MANRVDWLLEAVEDVESIAGLVARDSQSYASAWVHRILQAAQGLAEFPMKGRIVPEWNEDSIRELVIGNYRLIYRVHSSDVLILAVIHGARLLPESLMRRMG